MDVWVHECVCIFYAFILHVSRSLYGCSIFLWICLYVCMYVCAFVCIVCLHILSVYMFHVLVWRHIRLYYIQSVSDFDEVPQHLRSSKVHIVPYVYVWHGWIYKHGYLHTCLGIHVLNVFAFRCEEALCVTIKRCLMCYYKKISVEVPEYCFSC